MGGQKAIALFYQYLEKLLPVTLLSIADNNPKGFISSPLISVLGKNKKWRYINPFLFFKIRTILKTEQITHLILEHPYYGWLGILLKWFTKVRLIIHSQNIEALRFKSTGKWWWTVLWQYERFTHRNADFNFFITDEDRQYAIRHFGLLSEKCATITYGFEMMKPPAQEEIFFAKNQIRNQHEIAGDESILLFNGTLDYAPNLEALHIILKEINPLLISAGYKYKIIICGKNLPASLNGLAAYKSQNIIYAGFVNEIDIYFKATDIFINPVIEGGGIKTKVVEALGFNVSVVSTASGAIGIPQEIAGDKLKVIPDGEWELFAKAIMNTKTESPIPDEFFEYFYWGNIAERAANVIKK